MGDIEEPEYRAKVTDTRSELAGLPASDGKVIAFDDAARLVSSIDRAIDSASPEQLMALVRMLVAKVQTADRGVDAIELVPAGAAVLRAGARFAYGAPGRTRTADAGLRTASLCPLSYGGVERSYSADRRTGSPGPARDAR